MADIRAFRGFRYDLGRSGALADLVAPPYDVIDADLQRRLYDRSPFNAIRLELPLEETGDTPTRNRYTRAAQTLSNWLNENILQQDTLRTLYVVEQEYSGEGSIYRRRGFLARVRLEPFGAGQIYPHEQTMSGPKEDRFQLFRATGMNISPIFGLYPDPDNNVFGRLEAHLHRALPLEARDHLGTISRLWPVTDERVIGAVVSGMTQKPIYIADGHHRYETGLRYRDEARAAGMLAHDDAPANFTMMMLVSMSDPGLTILPTHRLISGWPGMTSERLRTTLAPHFRCAQLGSASAAWGALEQDGTQALLGLYTRADDTWQTARLVNPALMPKLAPEQSADWRNLAVSVLHVAAIDDLLARSERTKATCKYVHTLAEVDAAVAAKECDLVALVPPATMQDVERIAGQHEKMPAKSTYFYPKLLTGLVFNSLKTN